MFLLLFSFNGELGLESEVDNTNLDWLVRRFYSLTYILADRLRDNIDFLLCVETITPDCLIV